MVLSAVVAYFLADTEYHSRNTDRLKNDKRSRICSAEISRSGAFVSTNRSRYKQHQQNRNAIDVAFVLSSQEMQSENHMRKASNNRLQDKLPGYYKLSKYLESIPSQ